MKYYVEHLSDIELNDFIHEIMDNTLELQNKITSYSLENKQMIPKVEVTHYEIGDWSLVPGLIMDNFDHRWKLIQTLITSEEPQERYWIQECLKSLWGKGLELKPEYWDRLETEADVIIDIGAKDAEDARKYVQEGDPVHLNTYHQYCRTRSRKFYGIFIELPTWNHSA